MQKIFSEIWSKYDDAELLPDNERNLALEKILAELDDISEDKRNDEYFYLKGFINYNKDPSDIYQAKNFYQKALEINPDESYARLYYGHCLYDLGDYKEAEYNFSIVEKEGFSEIVRELLQMKAEEMIVCCQIKISGLDETNLSKAKAFVNKYFKVDYYDDYLFNLERVLKDFEIDLDELVIKNLKFRQATREDLPEIVRMLADDFLGATRERYENPLPESYTKAFEEIAADKNNELIVAVVSEPPAVAGGLSVENRITNLNVPNANLQPPATAGGSDEIIVGTLQITFTPSISFQGGKRATVESVRVDAKYRGQGLGKDLMLWAIERARREGCHVLQLTTNSDRSDAHRFYENLGFKGTHLGMKLYLK